MSSANRPEPPRVSRISLIKKNLPKQPPQAFDRQLSLCLADVGGDLGLPDHLANDFRECFCREKRG